MKQFIILYLLALSCFLSVNLKAQDTDSLQRESTLKRGIYLSFREFVANKPSMTDTFIVNKQLVVSRSGILNYWVTPISIHTGKPIVEIYGFCDGEKQYIFYNYAFLGVVKEDDQYLFYEFPFANPPEDDYVFLTQEPSDSIVKMSINESIKSFRKTYLLDSKTGQVFVKKWEGVELITYRRAKKEVQDTISLILNDSLHLDYIPNSANKFFFNLSKNQVKLCLEGTSNCIYITRDSSMVKFLKISNLKNANKIILEEVDKAQGEYESVIPIKRQRRRYSF